GACRRCFALELLAGAATGPRGQATLHVLDGETLEGRTVKVARAPGCPGCAIQSLPPFPSSREDTACPT
ncbi:HesA/MoeB/ThiF family protein, partial [Corallococcus sp. 4LFB]